MRVRIKIIFFSLCLFLVPSYFLYKANINNLYIQSEDTVPSLFLPVSIIKNKTLYADEYYEMARARYPHPDDKKYIKDLTPFYFRKIPARYYDYENKRVGIINHYISAFPLLPGLMAVPVYFLPVTFGMPITWDNLAVLGRITSALIVLGSGLVLFETLKKHFYLEEKKSELLTYIYLFGTINFSLISQGLWQHGPLQLFTLFSLWFLFEKKWLWSGVCMGFALLARPTAALFLPFYALLILSQFLEVNNLTKKEEVMRIIKEVPRSVVLFILGLIPPYMLFWWYTSDFYDGISNNGYAGQIFRGWLSRFPEGFLGMWLSPSKGILVYSPIFLFIFFWLFLIFRDGEWRLNKNFKYVISFCIVFLHTLIISRWKHWYGGWSFGYRMASDIIPFLIFLLVPFVQSEFFEKWKKVFFVIFGISVLMQIQGLVFFDGIWHAAYDRGFVDTSWLWSIVDSETMFNIRRILVKVGLLSRACPNCI